MLSRKLNINFDSELIESISSDFDLREPNKDALRKLVFTLEGNYNPSTMQVLNIATGVGKTYLMAAFIEYLRKQGIENVVIITPGKTVQSKTIQNFIQGNTRYIKGANVPPDIATPQDYSAWTARVNGDPRLSYGNEVPMLVFIFNIQQLIAPKSIDGDTRGKTQDSERRKPRRFDENAGVLFEYLKNLEDLVVIADESHLYSSSAVAFRAALDELEPAASIGLTASVMPEDNVIFQYPLYRAIQDKYVKAPVLAFRKGGYGDDLASEEQQLRDALRLRELKQAYYDTYSIQMKEEHLNAVLFVVCADVEHATQVTMLLRSPEYLGRELAVLQVDSKHDDETTQKLLENLDSPDSPVLAVVSVNKLKEGWDVKNIAVVVTLRAMASEVLTQQTMGRGLRLPFGAYTGVWQIDQLDIISHQSFKELLEAENILEQFGLEEAVSQTDKKKVIEYIQKAAESQSTDRKDETKQSENMQSVSSCTKVSDDEQSKSTESNSIADAYSPEGNSISHTVGVRTIDDMDNSYENNNLSIITIKRNPLFSDVKYKFPVTVVKLEQPPIDLSEIDDRTIEEAARKVTSTGDVLYRKEIVAALGKRLRTVDAVSAEVDSLHVDFEDASAALTKLIMNMQLVPSTSDTICYVKKYLVPKFMKHVGFEEWTVKSLESARMQLHSIIAEYISAIHRATKEIPIIKPKEMELQGYTLPLGEKVYDPIESRHQFERGRVYSGWFKSLFAEEYFDSFSGEYELARLLNTSPHIVWWHRLHPHDGAYIYYNSKDRYFPDFVALDDKGVYWIIEGKDKRGRDDNQVQNKRKAAESLVRKLVATDAFLDQNWGYLIAYEDDIAKSDTWDDLKTIASPVSNIL